MPVTMEQRLEVDVRRDRKRGHPSQMVGFRCPSELLKAANVEGRDQTDGLILLLDRAHDAREEMGKDWVEVVVRAHREGITEGQAMARLIKEALEKDRKKSR